MADPGVPEESTARPEPQATFRWLVQWIDDNAPSHFECQQALVRLRALRDGADRG